MKVLFLSAQVPTVRSLMGGARRLNLLARSLEPRCELTVICMDAGGEMGGREPLSGEFKRFLLLPGAPQPGGIGRLLRTPIDFAGQLRAHRPAIDAFLGDARFDLTLTAFPQALPLADVVGRERLGRRVHLEDDLVLEVYRKRIRAGGGLLARVLRRVRHRQLTAYYRSRLADADLFLCISRQEERLVRCYLPGLPTRILKHGLPLEGHPLLPQPEGPLTFGFIGNFRHAPNRDALEWIVARLLPSLAAADPEARCVVAGGGLPPGLSSDLARAHNLEYLGEVASLEDFYSRFAIFLNPIFTGRGLRTKLVEATAFGRPILSTPLGAEGLEDMEILMAMTPEEFLHRARTLTPEERTRIARRNREIFESNYTSEAVMDGLWPVLEAIGMGHGTRDSQ